MFFGPIGVLRLTAGPEEVRAPVTFKKLQRIQGLDLSICCDGPVRSPSMQHTPVVGFLHPGLLTEPPNVASSHLQTSSELRSATR